MGAWIEINSKAVAITEDNVAPHDGCVDWNKTNDGQEADFIRRTPRWVRGLKSWN